MKRIVLSVLALTAIGLTPAPAQEAYPSKPVRVIVPFPAGSATDVIARLVAQPLGERLGQQIVVDNRPGASGTVGVTAAAKAEPDGYTIVLITGSTHAVSPALGVSLPYDPVKDFEPISMLGAAPYVLVMYPGLGPKTIKELAELAKSKPGKLNYGSAGLASLAHLATAQLETQLGIDMTHVPYKSSAQSRVDIISGRLDMQIATVAPVLENVRSGQLRALATTGAKRVEMLPDVPTMMESGVPNYDVTLWMAFAAPAGTPQAIIGRLNKEMTTVLTMPKTQETMRKAAFEPEPGPADRVAKRIAAETEQWRALVKKTGIKAPGK